ncbi:PREDICTED: trithorax group protein osa-like isoform X2 [Priapulus caudatus]|uniref:Trithorax group protein osa-like isoform X2 n=1 Tax=Priapulus caudatus TaxID=37621 RepID=A0ABM1DY33_PRICU|nr:PREDICTED: trithorax group protein osa-like isoform X2 [Priapulus caudatus]
MPCRLLLLGHQRQNLGPAPTTTYEEAVGLPGNLPCDAEPSRGPVPPAYTAPPAAAYNPALAGQAYGPQPPSQVYPTGGQPMGASNLQGGYPMGNVSMAGYPVPPGGGVPYPQYAHGGVKYTNVSGMPPGGQYPPQVVGGMPPGGQYPPQVVGGVTYVALPVVGQPQTNRGMVIVQTNTKPPDYLIQSILVCICCFWPGGIIAIIYSMRVRSLYMEQRYDESWQASRVTRNVIVACVAIGIVFYVMITIARNLHH